MNVPIVLGLFEVEPHFTETAAILFDRFEKVGVVHRSPASAAKFLNAHYNTDIVKWWQDPKIQRLRLDFLEQYANNKPYFWPWLKAIIKQEI